MKLNWFSPLLPAKTDIAHFTLRVLPALLRNTQLTLWTDQADWDPFPFEGIEVRRYSLTNVRWTELNRGDMAIYNIGNNPNYHGAIWEMSQRHPGVVILHDWSLQEFFYSLYLGNWQDLNAYLTQMEFYYGWKGRADALFCFQNGSISLAYLSERYPLTQLALENALGVLVHTQAAFDSLNGARQMPLTCAPLPFAVPFNAEQSDAAALPQRTLGPPYRIIVFGYLGHNRRLSELLKALAQLPQRNQFRLDIFGQITDEQELRRLIAALDLKPLVKVHGFVPESELERALGRAHLAINMRYPTRGEASGSQLRIWSHALPSLVTPVGWYATLPKNTVEFVRPDYEVADLSAHLKAFLKDPARFAFMGREGRAAYEEKHKPDQYAKALVSLVEEAISYRPRAAWQQALNRAAKQKGDWLRWTPTEFHERHVAVRKDELLFGRSHVIPPRKHRIVRWTRRALKRQVLYWSALVGLDGNAIVQSLRRKSQ